MKMKKPWMGILLGLGGCIVYVILIFNVRPLRTGAGSRDQTGCEIKGGRRTEEFQTGNASLKLPAAEQTKAGNEQSRKGIMGNVNLTGSEFYRKFHHDTTFYVFTTKKGKLGNNLFQYASLLGIAAHSNRTPLYDHNMLYLKTVFPKLEIPVVQIQDTVSWAKITEVMVSVFDKNIFNNLPIGTNVYVDGYLISFRYFEAISDMFYRDVLSHFNTTLSDKAIAFIGSVKRQYGFKNNGVTPRTVCVHVRRGEWATEFYKKRTQIQLPEAKDILGAMATMESKHKNVAFVLATDTKDWCKEHLSGPNVYFSNMTSSYEDFVLLSSCDDVIMTSGTFGWWASWLTWKRGGSVMYYKHVYVPGSPRDKKFDIRDWFPQEWTPYP